MFNLEVIDEVSLKIIVLMLYVLGTISSKPPLNLKKKKNRFFFKLVTYPFVLFFAVGAVLCTLYMVFQQFSSPENFLGRTVYEV